MVKIGGMDLWALLEAESAYLIEEIKLQTTIGGFLSQKNFQAAPCVRACIN
jgi:hypothetical protein